MNTCKEFGNLDRSYKWIKGCIILCAEAKKTISDDLGSITPGSSSSVSTTFENQTVSISKPLKNLLYKFFFGMFYIKGCHLAQKQIFSNYVVHVQTKFCIGHIRGDSMI